MNFDRFFRIFSLLLLFFCFSFPCLCLAQGGIKVSPLRIEGTVDPGQVIQKKIKITNVSGDPVTLYSHLWDFKAKGETGYPDLMPAGSEIYGSGSWVNLPSEEISFSPKEEKEILVTLRVPEGVGPGGYYGAITFGTLPPETRLRGVGEERGAAIVVGQETGCLVLLKVAGDINEEAMIREFSTDRDFYSTPFEVNFVTRVKNLGNVHVKPRGTIEVSNILGGKTEALKVNELGANVLPGSIRRFEKSWKGELGFGRYTALLILSFGTPADEGGQGAQTIHTQTSFWIVPWRIIIPSFLGLIFVGSLFLLFLRIYRNKAIEKAMKKAGLTRVKYIKKYEGPSPVFHLTLIIVLILIIVLLVAGVIFFLFFA